MSAGDEKFHNRNRFRTEFENLRANLFSDQNKKTNVFPVPHCDRACQAILIFYKSHEKDNTMDLQEKASEVVW